MHNFADLGQMKKKSFIKEIINKIKKRIFQFNKFKFFIFT